MDVCNKSTIGGDLDMKAVALWISTGDFRRCSGPLFIGRFLKGRFFPVFFRCNFYPGSWCLVILYGW